MADAGWYPDAHDPNQQQYFDGQNWTGQYRPNSAASYGAGPATGAASDDTVRRGDLAAERQWNQQQGQPAAPQWAQPNQQPNQQPAQQPYQQPYQQPGQYAQPNQQPTQQWAQPDQGGYGAGQWQPGPATPAPAPSGSRRRTPLIIAGVAAAAVVAGVITFLVWPGDDAPAITYEGKSISSADATLASAEKAVAKAVSDRKGAKNDDTRCYFAKPKKPASGDKASDIDDALRCGPVLYVDGVRTAAYLSVPFTETTKGSSVELEVRDDVNDIEPAALNTELDLVRPDGKTAPTDNGGAGSLTVPQPPAATKDLLTTGTLQSDDDVKTIGKSLIGRNLGITLVKAGEIKRFGEGDDARSAPSGQRLIAFQMSYRSGDQDQTGDTPATLVTSGGSPRPIPDADGDDTYVIAAVPTAGASIVLLDGGFSQSISVPDGKVGPNPIAVLQRANRTAVIGTKFTVPVSLRASGGRTGKVTFRGTAFAASLNFWAPGNRDVHPRNPANAILSIRLTYTIKGESDTFGFAPGLLKLRVGGQTYPARNVASGGRINDVFEVPSTFTSGTLVISGTAREGGITETVTKSRSIPIRIGA